jgi:excisionase family DNA binding protein
MHTPDKTELPRPRRTAPFETPLLVSVPEAARLLGIGTTFGWAMVRSGDMPTVRLGRRVLVPRAALERLARTHGSDETAQESDGTYDKPRLPGPILRQQDT